MKPFAYAALGFFSLLGPVLAAPQGLDLETVNKAEWTDKSGKGKEIDPALIKVQVLLDRARFSPGVIDGHNGENLRNAIKAFEKARELKADGALDKEAWAKLNETSPEPVLTEYTIREEDVKGPFVEKFPTSWKIRRSSTVLVIPALKNCWPRSSTWTWICSRL